MSSAAKLGAKSDLWIMDRKDLIVIGHDTDDGPEHELYRADVRDPVDESLAPSIRKHGVIQPIRARRCKSDSSRAEVIVGRSRVRAVEAIAKDGGPSIKIPVMLWPAGATLAEIVGVANAENHVRKTESILVTADHAHAQLRAEGGAEVKGAINSVAVDLGISPARVRSLLKLREAPDVIAALKASAIKGEVALTLATLPDEQRAVELAIAIEGKSTIVEVRENVAKVKAKAAGRAPKVSASDAMRDRLAAALGREYLTLADAVDAACARLEVLS